MDYVSSNVLQVFVVCLVSHPDFRVRSYDPLCFKHVVVLQGFVHHAVNK